MRISKSKTVRLFLLFGILFVLSACAGTADKREPTPYERATFPERTLDCIFVRTLYDWKAIDPFRLVVWAPNRSTPYLLELDEPCTDLRFAERVLFTDRAGRVCTGNSVIVPGSIRKECRIGAIHPLNEDELRQVLSEEFPAKREKGPASKEEGSGSSDD